MLVRLCSISLDLALQNDYDVWHLIQFVLAVSFE